MRRVVPGDRGATPVVPSLSDSITHRRGAFELPRCACALLRTRAAAPISLHMLGTHRANPSGMPDCRLSATPSAAPAWEASLRLGFVRDGATTRLLRREHRGPLRVQKALYPEGPALLPRDRRASARRRGRRRPARDRAWTPAPAVAVLATSPGAAKWYRANGRVSRQHVRLRAGAGAAIEWLPQETIFYDAPTSNSNTRSNSAPAPSTRQRNPVLRPPGLGRTLRQRPGAPAHPHPPGGPPAVVGAGRADGGRHRQPARPERRPVCATFLAVGKPVPARCWPPARGRPAAGAEPGEIGLRGALAGRRWRGGARGHAARVAGAASALPGQGACVPRIWHT
jgi:urease accessory protein